MLTSSVSQPLAVVPPAMPTDENFDPNTGPLFDDSLMHKTVFRSWTWSPDAPAACECVPGLQALLANNGMSSFGDAADVWCRENGAAEFTDFVDCMAVDDFVQALSGHGVLTIDMENKLMAALRREAHRPPVRLGRACSEIGVQLRTNTACRTPAMALGSQALPLEAATHRERSPRYAWPLILNDSRSLNDFKEDGRKPLAVNSAHRRARRITELKDSAKEGSGGE